jgi:radical SAM superfamily enzyme YgiQ (UPF0313 family)
VQYEGHVIRPPSEAESILLEVTVGCSHHRCSFCGAYLADRFRIKHDQAIFADIAYAARHFRDRERVFLLNGDALIVPSRRLLPILGEIARELPWVTRVATYANAKSVARKSDQELSELRSLGLKLLHMGLESGDDVTLGAVDKFGNAEFIVEQGRRARAAGMKLFVTVLLGLGGAERSLEHARATGRALTALQPDYVGALSLMLIPGTPLFDDWRAGRFVLGGPDAMLRELRELLAHTELTRGIFYANHASNYLPIRARLPRDKAQTLALLDAAVGGKVALKPEWLRGL